MRDELVGLSTVSTLSLLGFALYTTTYALVYSSSSSKPVVAVLEMWSISTHLITSLACVVIHIISMSVFEVQSFVSNIVTSVFLGISILSSIVCSSCLTYGEEKVCRAYFGASISPKISSVGFCVWCWVMYVASLGGQSTSIGSSLGFSKMGCFIIISIILLGVHSIGSKIWFTCGNDWVCKGGSCADTIILVVIFLSSFCMGIGETLHNTYKDRVNNQNVNFKSKQSKKTILLASFIFRLLGCIIMIVGICLLMIEQTNHQMMGHITCIFITLVPFISTLMTNENKKYSPQTSYGYEPLPTNSEISFNFSNAGSNNNNK